MKNIATALTYLPLSYHCRLKMYSYFIQNKNNYINVKNKQSKTKKQTTSDSSSV